MFPSSRCHRRDSLRILLPSGAQVVPAPVPSQTGTRAPRASAPRSSLPFSITPRPLLWSSILRRMDEPGDDLGFIFWILGSSHRWVSFSGFWSLLEGVGCIAAPRRVVESHMKGKNCLERHWNRWFFFEQGKNKMNQHARPQLFACSSIGRAGITRSCISILANGDTVADLYEPV